MTDDAAQRREEDTIVEADDGKLMKSWDEIWKAAKRGQSIVSNIGRGLLSIKDGDVYIHTECGDKCIEESRTIDDVVYIRAAPRRKEGEG